MALDDRHRDERTGHGVGSGKPLLANKNKPDGSIVLGGDGRPGREPETLPRLPSCCCSTSMPGPNGAGRRRGQRHAPQADQQALRQERGSGKAGVPGNSGTAGAGPGASMFTPVRVKARPARFYALAGSIGQLWRRPVPGVVRCEAVGSPPSIRVSTGDRQATLRGSRMIRKQHYSLAPQQPVDRSRGQGAPITDRARGRRQITWP